MHAAYEGLPAELKRRLEGMTVLHDFEKFWEMMRREKGSRRPPLTDAQRKAEAAGLASGAPHSSAHRPQGALRQSRLCRAHQRAAGEGKRRDARVPVRAPARARVPLRIPLAARATSSMWEDIGTIHNAVADYGPGRASPHQALPGDGGPLFLRWKEGRRRVQSENPPPRRRFGPLRLPSRLSLVSWRDLAFTLGPIVVLSVAAIWAALLVRAAGSARYDRHYRGSRRQHLPGSRRALPQDTGAQRRPSPDTFVARLAGESQAPRRPRVHRRRRLRAGRRVRRREYRWPRIAGQHVPPAARGLLHRAAHCAAFAS